MGYHKYKGYDQYMKSYDEYINSYLKKYLLYEVIATAPTVSMVSGIN